MNQPKDSKSTNWIILIYFVVTTTIYMLVSLLIVPNPWAIS